MPRSLEEIVNRQVLRWQEEARACPSAAAPGVLAPPEAPHRPMISISREYGGRGAAVAQRVADKLGFHLYGRELLDEIARETHVRRQVLESLDEHVQTAIEEMVRSSVGSEYFSNTEFLHNLSRVMLTIARHGRGVIVGRGAQFILHPGWTLRVRCTAPLEDRIARIAERDRIARAGARARVLREDAEREAFYRLHFDRDAADPAHYDLVLNTSTLSEETCADLVTEAFWARFARFGGLVRP